MSSSDQTVAEIARKSEALWLHAFSETPNRNNEIAEFLNLSAATVSKFKSPEQSIHLANVCQMLAALGLKIVSADEQHIADDRLNAIIYFADLGFKSLKEKNK